MDVNFKKALDEKLLELGGWQDEMFTEYVMVLLQNENTLEEMVEKLQVFLGESAHPFSRWLMQVKEARANKAPEKRSEEPPEEKPKPVLHSKISDDFKPQRFTPGFRLLSSAINESLQDHRVEPRRQLHEEPAVRSQVGKVSVKMSHRGKPGGMGREPRVRQRQVTTASGKIRVLLQNQTESENEDSDGQQGKDTDFRRARGRGRGSNRREVVADANEGGSDAEMDDGEGVVILTRPNQYGNQPGRPKISKALKARLSLTPGHHEQRDVPEVCAFWPHCLNGDKCQFQHPKVCVHFPRCMFGKACQFFHPKVPCKFDAACQNSNCNFVHTTPCWFGSECRRPSCHFSHPPVKQAQHPSISSIHTSVNKKLINQPGPRKMCVNGPACTQPGCTYRHSSTAKSFS